MKNIILLFAIIGSLLSTCTAAPWVVLDSRNDMLAMSSEISDSAVAYTVPSSATTLGTNNDEAVTTTTENEPEVSNDNPATTSEQPPQADSVPEPEPEVLPAEEAGQDTIETTVKPVSDDVQDIPEATTMQSYSSSVGSLLEDDIQSEDMNLKVIPEIPISPPRQNPNSIEGDEQLASVIVISKKKHEIFNGKKSKFSM